MENNSLKRAFEEHIEWIETHKGDIDISTFREESLFLAQRACRKLGIREWAGFPNGVLALDFVASVLGMTLPRLAWKYPWLPGSITYKDKYYSVDI